LNANGLKWTPLSKQITAGIDAATALDIVEKLLKNIMHINS